jgi:hypothetical protein
MSGMGGWYSIIPKKTLSLRIKNIQTAINDKLDVKDLQREMRDIKSNIPNLFIDEYGGEGSKTLFIGDSNMQQYYPRIIQLLKNKKNQSRGCVFLTAQGVLPIEGMKNRYQPITSSEPITKEITKIIAKEPRIDRVVIAARWLLYFRYKGGDGYELHGRSVGDINIQKECFDQLGKEIRELVGKNKKVYVVLTIPTGEELDPSKMAHARNHKHLYKDEFIKQNYTIINSIKSVAAANGAEVIDPLDYLCQNGVCIAEDENGVPIRFDEGHLRPGYVRDHVKYLDHTIEP